MAGVSVRKASILVIRVCLFVGSYCYYVTAVEKSDATNQSAPSNTADGKAKPFAATNVTVQ